MHRLAKEIEIHDTEIKVICDVLGQFHRVEIGHTIYSTKEQSVATIERSTLTELIPLQTVFCRECLHQPAFCIQSRQSLTSGNPDITTFGDFKTQHLLAFGSFRKTLQPPRGDIILHQTVAGG